MRDIADVVIDHVTTKFDACAGCRFNCFRVNETVFSLIDKQAAEILCEYCDELGNYHAFSEDDVEMMMEKIAGW